MTYHAVGIRVRLQHNLVNLLCMPSVTIIIIIIIKIIINNNISIPIRGRVRGLPLKSTSLRASANSFFEMPPLRSRSNCWIVTYNNQHHIGDDVLG
jgi:hypothetical protein